MLSSQNTTARVGLVAISFGAGPVLLAAGETPAGRLVRFVVTIGGLTQKFTLK